MTLDTFPGKRDIIVKTNIHVPSGWKAQIALFQIRQIKMLKCTPLNAQGSERI